MKKTFPGEMRTAECAVVTRPVEPRTVRIDVRTEQPVEPRTVRIDVRTEKKRDSPRSTVYVGARPPNCPQCPVYAGTRPLPLSTVHAGAKQSHAPQTKGLTSGRRAQARDEQRLPAPARPKA
jgi:hypothetical protein